MTAKDTNPVPPRPRRLRLWLFRAVVAVALYGVLELGSLATFYHRDGRPFSFADVHRQQKQVEYVVASTSGPAGENPYAFHPYLGVIYNPRVVQDLPLENPITPYGYSDTAPPIHKRSEGKVIIGVLGGSVASIFSCQGRQTLVEELRRSRRFSGKEIVVVNLAVGGFKQPQQVMSLDYALALGGEFDIVLNLDGYNEVALYPAENWADGVFPLYPRAWQHAVGTLPDLPTRLLLGEMSYLQGKRRAWARLVRRSPLHYSVTANLLWSIRDRHLKDRILTAVGELHARRHHGLPYAAVGPYKPLPDEEAMYQELASIWERCSLQLHRTCRGHGIEYFHFLQPNQYDKGSKEMGPEEREVAWLDTFPGKRSVELGYPLLRAAGRDLARQGVRFHDLSGVFAGHPEHLYLDQCCHFGLDGNVILARAVAAALTETAEPPTQAPLAPGGVAKEDDG